MRDVRVTLAVARLLGIFLEELPAEQYGYKLMQDTGFSSGKVYQILARLEAAGWICRREDDGLSGGPARVTYTLEPAAVPLARRALARVRAELEPSRGDTRTRLPVPGARVAPAAGAQ